MTIKEPINTINTTSDATFLSLSVLCEKPQKVLLAKSWGAVAPPAPPGITPLDSAQLSEITKKNCLLEVELAK